MTLIEAINSGKKFKRENWGAWLLPPKKYGFIRYDHGEGYKLTAQDALADDWHNPEPKKILFTWKQIERVLCLSDCCDDSELGYIKIELGFGDEDDQ